MQVEEAEVGGMITNYTRGKCWGDICGLLEKAMGRTDRKDQETIGKQDLEGERTWRRGGGAGVLGEHAAASEHLSSDWQWESYL